MMVEKINGCEDELFDGLKYVRENGAEVYENSEELNRAELEKFRSLNIKRLRINN